MSIEGTSDATEPTRENGEGSAVSGWIMARVNRWRNVRNANYLRSWDDYYNIWRGVWTPQQQGREAERSRLIAPATQQAVDATIAEMTEATFGRGMWFDLDDTVAPDKLPQAATCRTNLLADFQRDALKHAVIESFTNGCIYGTGVAKRIVDEAEHTTIKEDALFGGFTEEKDLVKKVYWDAVPPFNFVIDTTAKTIDEALGCAHETVRPYHEIKQKQASGEYYDVSVGTMSGYNMALVLRGPRGESLEIDPEDGCYLTEYHGLVPKDLYDEACEGDESAEPMADVRMDPTTSEGSANGAEDSGEYVEVIATIANGGTLLKLVKNPFGGDRGFIAYPHDKVPNKFWGRGVCEKAWNSQKALDAELRARIDSLAIRTYPVMGADATRLPRNLNLQIVPGKTIYTHGRPSEIIEPISFGNMDPISFQQSGDLERMVQMATGAMDSATPVNINSRNETAAGASMMSGAMIKRAKLTMQNVDTWFLQPLINKTLRAYRVIDPERYPVDVSFRVNTTMSIMAREYEQSQMTNLLAIIPPQTPAFNVILTAIAENYSGPSKDKLVAAINQMSQPNPEQQKQQQQMEALNMAHAVAQLHKLQKEIEKIAAEAQFIQGPKTHKEDAMSFVEHARVQNETANVAVQAQNTNLKKEELDIERQRLPIERMKAENVGKSKQAGAK